MQLINRVRSFIAGVLSRLAGKIYKPDNTQLAITYNVPDKKDHNNMVIEEKEPLKVVSYKVKNIKRIKKVKEKKEN